MTKVLWRSTGPASSQIPATPTLARKQAGHAYRFEELTSFSARIYVLDDEGDMLASVDTPELIELEFDAERTVFFGVRHRSLASIGSWTVRVRDQGVDAHGDFAVQASSLVVGSVVEGMLETAADEDWFVFTTGASQAYAVSVSGAGKQVRLYASDAQTQLGQVSDGSASFHLEAASTYYLRVRSGTSGAYELQVQD